MRQCSMFFIFFFNDTATTEIYTLSLHDALPILIILRPAIIESSHREPFPGWIQGSRMADPIIMAYAKGVLREFPRSEQHTSELQSRQYLVCRLLLEKKKTNDTVIS